MKTKQYCIVLKDSLNTIIMYTKQSQQTPTGTEQEQSNTDIYFP